MQSEPTLSWVKVFSVEALAKDHRGSGTGVSGLKDLCKINPQETVNN